MTPLPPPATPKKPAEPEAQREPRRGAARSSRAIRWGGRRGAASASCNAEKTTGARSATRGRRGAATIVALSRKSGSLRRFGVALPRRCNRPGRPGRPAAQGFALRFGLRPTASRNARCSCRVHFSRSAAIANRPNPNRRAAPPRTSPSFIRTRRRCRRSLNSRAKSAAMKRPPSLPSCRDL